MPSNHLILCRPLLLSSVFPSIRVFSNESVPCIRWPKYWSFRFSNRSLKRILTSLGWLVGSPCSPGDSQESSPTPQFKSLNSSVLNFLYSPHLSHPYMTTGKTIDLTRWTFVSKVTSLLFNMLSGLVIAFLPRSKHLLISWLQSPSEVILEPPPNKVCHYFHCFPCFPIYLPWSDGTGCHDLSFLNVEFQANFFTLFFHFHQEALQFLFTFCHNGGVICYLRLLIFLLEILIPACA